MFTNIILPLATLIIGATIPLITLYLNRKDMLRIALIEKRLQAHQEAFSWWYKLILVIHSTSSERIPIINAARKFWFEKCLYLEKNTRNEFDTVLKLIDGYSDKLQKAKITLDQKAKEEMRQDYLGDWDRIFKLPELIQREVRLQPIVPYVRISAEG